MPTYTPWTWSQPHARHYAYLLSDDGRILETIWSGPAASAAPSQRTQGQSRARNSSQPLGASRSFERTMGKNMVYDEGDAEDDEEENEDEDDDGGENEDDETNVRRNSGTHPSRNDGTYGSKPNVYQHSTWANNARSDSAMTRSWQWQHTSVPNIATGPATLTNALPTAASTMSNLPPDTQASIGYKDRRYIKADNDKNDSERLDARYRRVSSMHHRFFFVPGRVFKMLWSEPAGRSNPGVTRNSTHFSTVWLGERAYSEIRCFLVVRNKGTFSQCIPIQTYRGRGAAKPGLIMSDHGVIHTSDTAPPLVEGETLTKYSIRVASSGAESLAPTSRVNYGKPYVVEHNVKVLDIGVVVEQHRYLIGVYFDSALRGE